MKWQLTPLLFLTCTLCAQQALTEVKKQAFGNPFNSANENFINLTNQMAAGKEVSLLLFDEWCPMEIFGMEESHILVDSANYHISADKVFFVEDGRIFELYPGKIEHIRLGDLRMINSRYRDDKMKLKPRSYFEVLVEGDYTLLRKYAIEEEVRNDHPMGLPASREVELKRDEKLYYLSSTRRYPEEVPRRKRDFIECFRRHRPEMMIFAKENKISLKDANDVQRIFAYYNSLAEG